jgi:hypothetical protein
MSLSGALVGGLVGALVGAVVEQTAGRGSYSERRRRAARRLRQPFAGPTLQRSSVMSEQAVVRHEFYGVDRQEAIDILRAHLGAETFLRQCTFQGHYGQVICRTELSIRAPDGTEEALEL